MFAAIMIEIQSLHVGSALRFSHSSFHIIIAKGLWSILTFTCSKSTIESQEKGVKYVQSLTLNINQTFF